MSFVPDDVHNWDACTQVRACVDSADTMGLVVVGLPSGHQGRTFSTDIYPEKTSLLAAFTANAVHNIGSPVVKYFRAVIYLQPIFAIYWLQMEHPHTRANDTHMTLQRYLYVLCIGLISSTSFWCARRQPTCSTCQPSAPTRRTRP